MPKSTRHAVYEGNYHVVSIPKYREQCLIGATAEGLHIACTGEEFGITVEARPEAWTSQECPNCGSTEDTTRHQDTLTCTCGFEGHADLTASETFLRRHETDVPRPMARPVCLKGDDHHWSASSRAHRPNEELTDPQVTAGDSASPNPHGGILAL